MTVGFFHPQIIISTGLIKKLPSKQLESVVLHELYHLKNKHPLLLIISEIICSSLFFIPLLKELARSMKIIFEKEADLSVIGKQKTDLYLKLALVQVVSTPTYFPYPKFVQRRHYKTNYFNINLSFFFIFLLIALSLFPTKAHATQTAGSIKTTFKVNNIGGLTYTHEGCTVLTYKQKTNIN